VNYQNAFLEKALRLISYFINLILLAIQSITVINSFQILIDPSVKSIFFSARFDSR
jgi:hypothetical protein